MQTLVFDTHFVRARKDLINFIEDLTSPTIYTKIGEDPQRWIEELGIVKKMLGKSENGDQDMISVSLNLPPKDDSKFDKLGENVYLYRGEQKRVRGLWIYSPNAPNAEHGELYNWSQYNVGSSARLNINEKFSGISKESLLPENFILDGNLVKNNKRPVYSITVDNGENELQIFAKGSQIRTARYENTPSYRLTNISDVAKDSPKREMEIFLDLSSKGVRTPEIVGSYESLYEDFLFTKKIEGETPDKYMESERYTLIEQDAQMLAALCLAGKTKQGFADFDDKIFDGNKLYLIDADEVVPLYHLNKSELEKILSDPNDKKKLRSFRSYQKELFKRSLRDALFEYKDTLTPKQSDMTFYVESFFRSVGWKEPDSSISNKMTSFPSDYMTFDRHMSLMSDTG